MERTGIAEFVSFFGGLPKPISGAQAYFGCRNAIKKLCRREPHFSLSQFYRVISPPGSTTTGSASVSARILSAQAFASCSIGGNVL